MIKLPTTCSAEKPHPAVSTAFPKSGVGSRSVREESVATDDSVCCLIESYAQPDPLLGRIRSHSERRQGSLGGRAEGYRQVHPTAR
jgi:hypothetical protein